jgi:hypothetical protein
MTVTGRIGPISAGSTAVEAANGWVLAMRATSGVFDDFNRGVVLSYGAP